MKNAMMTSLPHKGPVIRARVRSLRTHGAGPWGPRRSRSNTATTGNTWASQPAPLLVLLVSLQKPITQNNLCNVFADQTDFKHVIIVYGLTSCPTF